MNLKNLSVKNKTRSQILEYLNKKKISRIYKKFAASLQVEENLAVAVSGGPDSLALAYLAKCYAIKKNIKIYYFIVDHRLRSESSLEAKNIKNFFKTGDLGKFDKNNNLIFVDRRKDIIVKGGVNIMPSEIEEVIKEIGKDSLRETDLGSSLETIKTEK